METAIKQFDAAKELEGIVAWTRTWFETNGPEAMAVIGLSGGKDSTIAAAILAKAIGPDRILGLIMPDGDMPDISDAIRAAKVCGIQPIIIDIQWATFAMLGRVGNTLLTCIPGCDINRKAGQRKHRIARTERRAAHPTRQMPQIMIGKPFAVIEIQQQTLVMDADHIGRARCIQMKYLFCFVEKDHSNTSNLKVNGLTHKQTDNIAEIGKQDREHK